MADANKNRAQSTGQALSSAALAHLYLESLHQTIERTFEDIWSLVELVGTLGPSDKERFRNETSHGLNLLYMAEEQAKTAKHGVETAERALNAAGKGA